MEFTWTPEQLDLRAGTRRLLEGRAPLERTRALAEAGERLDPAAWTAMTEQAGLLALGVPRFVPSTAASAFHLPHLRAGRPTADFELSFGDVTAGATTSVT
jgi:hypothetical protein